MKNISRYQYSAIFKAFLIFISINSIFSFNCGFNELNVNPVSLDKIVLYNRVNAENGFQPIRIKADYSSFKKIDSISDEDLNQAREAVEETLSEFSKFLNVQHVSIKLDGYGERIKEACQIDEIDDNYENFFDNYDLVIFPTFSSNLSETTIAAATYCLYDKNTYQPYFGILRINPKNDFNKKNAKRYLKTVLLHEITHILVFHPNLFKKLGIVKTENSVSYINSPKVLRKARQHFNCPSLKGVPLENQGGSGSLGSHWEARYMLGDYMISTDYMDTVISDITLALFEDSGFYQVNYYTGGLFKFGKNQGCSFLNSKCIVNGETQYENEFCTSFGEDSCSTTRENKGKCYVYSYSSNIPEQYRYFSEPNYGGFFPCDYCPVTSTPSESNENDYYPSNCRFGESSLSSYGEVISDTSFCFLSSLLPSSSSLTSQFQAICYKVNCDNTNKKIIVNIGSSSVECPTSGGTLSDPSGFTGSIKCPKYIDICSYENNNMCNDLFECLDKKSKSDPDTYIYVDDDDEGNDGNDGEDNNIPIYRPYPNSSSNYLQKTLYMYLLFVLFY